MGKDTIQRPIPVRRLEDDTRYRDDWGSYLALMNRRGVSSDLALAVMRINTTAFAALMVQRGKAGSMICGTVGEYRGHLKDVEQILAQDHLHPQDALSLLIVDQGPIFVAASHMDLTPPATQVAETAIAAARYMLCFGLTPGVALCSNSQFGNLDNDPRRRMCEALAMQDARAPGFEYEVGMRTDMALRDKLFPGGRLAGGANALLYSNSETTGAVRKLPKLIGHGLDAGPILRGMGNRAHVVTSSVTYAGLAEYRRPRRCRAGALRLKRPVANKSIMNIEFII